MVILFNVVIEDLDVAMGVFGFPDTRSFSFIVHRHALLAHIPEAQPACEPFHTVSAGKSIPTLVEVLWSTWGIAATLRHRVHRCVRCKLSPPHVTHM
jgi:hypothetical protein